MEAAHALGLSRQRIHQMVAAGLLPARKRAGLTLIPLTAIIKELRRRVVASKELAAKRRAVARRLEKKG